MKFTEQVTGIRDAYVAIFPVPHGAPGEAIEEECRQWSIHLAETIRARTGDASYGVKRADPGRPIGKDTLAKMQGGRLLVWDLLRGAGTGNGELVDDPDSEDVTGQTFVPVVAHDWIGAVVVIPPVDPPPPPPPPPTDLGPLARQIAHLEELLKAHEDASERRYKDLINHIAAAGGGKGMTGSVNLFGVRGAVDLTPKP